MSNDAESRPAWVMLAAGVAHDLNNLIMGMGSVMDVIESEIPPGNESMIGVFRTALQSTSALARDLGSLGDASPLTVTTLSLQHMLASWLATFQRNLGSTWTLQHEPANPSIEVRVDPEVFHKGLCLLSGHIVDDAVPHTFIHLRFHAHATTHDIEIEYASSRPIESVERAFLPYGVATRTRGAGLRLVLAHTLLQRAGGDCSVSVPSTGRHLFRVSVPLS